MSPEKPSHETLGVLGALAVRPPVRGGQGRSEQDLLDDAWIVLACTGLLALVLIAAIVRSLCAS